MKTKQLIKNSIFTLNQNPLTKYLYKKEINFRSKQPVTNIEILAKRLNMFSPYSDEIHKPNDWYGHATNFKAFLGLPLSYQFKFTIEHGVYLTEQIDRLDLESNLPSVLTYCDYRAGLFKKHNKETYIIGPFINYAENLLNKDQAKTEKKLIGSCLLLIPNHSSLEIEIGYDINELCKKVKKIGKNFDTVRVCLYWTDIVLNKYKIYQEYGFECVTAGHTLDPLFLPRLRSIIESSDLTVSNAAGTHVGYSVFLNRPHIILIQKFKLNANKYWKNRIEDFWKSDPFNQVLHEFSKDSFKITDKQRKLVQKYWGSNAIKNKQEFLKIIEDSEKIYQKINSN